MMQPQSTINEEIVKHANNILLRYMKTLDNITKPKENTFKVELDDN